MRTFIAIELAPEIKSELTRLIQNLASLTKNVRWVRADGLHLTLKFLGEILDAQAGRVSAVVEPCCRGRSPFSLSVKGTGWFPPGSKSPRVLWVGLEAGPDLASLQSGIELALAKEGFPSEKRDFHPHLTMGRIRSPHGLRPVLDELERAKDSEFGRMTVSHVTFFQSRLKPDGAEYSILGRFPLS
jgi:2'-5' RNA ligase